MGTAGMRPMSYSEGVMSRLACQVKYRGSWKDRGASDISSSHDRPDHCLAERYVVVQQKYQTNIW